MNKIVASLGMAALGASSLQVVSAQELSSAPPSKFWNVTASLRGFYDDNVNTVSTDETETTGFEVTPGVGVNWQNDGTMVRAGYRYGFKYYDKKPAGNTEHFDQTHTFDAQLDHAINERFRLGATDSFVVGQEPDSLRTGAFGATQRISGDNIRNYGRISLDAQLTRLFGLEVGYDNSYFDYHDQLDGGFAGVASNSGLLDRIEHKANIDARLQMAPKTTGVLGYAYGQNDYTADEQISTSGDMSDVRNSRSHYVYLGVDQIFNPNFTGSIRGGLQYIDFYKQDETDTSPYIQASLSYLYAVESKFELGFTQSRSPIDAMGDAGTYVRDADTSVLFGSVRHRIVPNLFGSLIGTFQNSTFNGGGSYDGKSDQYYQLGLNLEYKWTAYLSSEIGYNFDKVASEIPGREYDRNRVYIGLTASY